MRKPFFLLFVGANLDDGTQIRPCTPRLFMVLAFGTESIGHHGQQKRRVEEGSFQVKKGCVMHFGLFLVLNGNLSTEAYATNLMNLGKNRRPVNWTFTLEKIQQSLVLEQAHEEMDMEALIAYDKLAYKGLEFVLEARVSCNREWAGRAHACTCKFLSAEESHGFWKSAQYVCGWLSLSCRVTQWTIMSHLQECWRQVIITYLAM